MSFLASVRGGEGEVFKRALPHYDVDAFQFQGHNSIDDYSHYSHFAHSLPAYSTVRNLKKKKRSFVLNKNYAYKAFFSFWNLRKTPIGIGGSNKDGKNLKIRITNVVIRFPCLTQLYCVLFGYVIEPKTQNLNVQAQKFSGRKI